MYHIYSFHTWVMCLGHDSAALGAPAVEIWPGEDPLLHPPPLNLLPHSDKVMNSVRNSVLTSQFGMISVQQGEKL